MRRHIFIFLFISLAYSVTFQDGYNKFVVGDYQQAIDIFQKLLAETPEDYKTTLWIGKSCFYLGDQKKAIDTLIKAVKLNPEDTEAKELLEQVEYVRGYKKVAEMYYHKGYFAYMKGDYQTAKDNYWQAILLDSEVSKYHVWHLRSLIGLGELSKARAELDYAVKLKPYDNSLSILGSEELRLVKPDKEYYDLLVNLKHKKLINKTEEVTVVPAINSTKKTIKASLANDISAVSMNTLVNKTKTTAVKEVVLSKNEEFVSEIPTLNPSMLRKESSAFQGNTTKARFSF
ncbi:MAG: tetratricopeptide repeat protein [Candidatus Margulisbacteria bacterium]|nr:tetratricopeptide repeat protein [Candidatus Margulisiibacteriota bacterium]